MQRSGRRPPRLRRPSAHVPRLRDEVRHIKLFVKGELIDVVLDETGIHFSQTGTGSATGHLDWERALGMSLFGQGTREPAA